MGVKAATCTLCALVSLMGMFFYITCAVMVMRENQVFLEHKVGINTFTVTQTELNNKFFRIASAAIVRYFFVYKIFCIGYVYRDELLFVERCYIQQRRKHFK